MMKLLMSYWNICESIAIGGATISVAVIGVMLVGFIILGIGSLIFNTIQELLCKLLRFK